MFIVLEQKQKYTIRKSQFSMILKEFDKTKYVQDIMVNHRDVYNRIKGLVMTYKFNLIDIKQVNNENQLVIQHLNSDDEALYDSFSQLVNYQKRYLSLSKFLISLRKDVGILNQRETQKLVEMFKEPSQIDNSSHCYPQTKTPIKSSDLLGTTEESQKLPVNSTYNHKLPQMIITSPSQYFDNKQRSSKHIGFAVLLQPSHPASTRASNYMKKFTKHNQNVEMKKLLEQNKKLRLQLQNKDKQDQQVNQFQKHMLKQQKQIAFARVRQLEEKISQLTNSQNNKQENHQSRKAFSAVKVAPLQLSINEVHPPYPHNNYLHKNKLTTFSQISFIPKNNQPSFQIMLNKYSSQPNLQNSNNLIQLLQDFDNYARKERVQGFIQVKTQQQSCFQKQKNYQNKQSPGNPLQNDSLLNGNRFDSFSLAKTTDNNNSLFLNVSRKLVAIDSKTSTRNKVAFFKNSLVIMKDNDFQIAFKRSNIDNSYSKIRLILYINNKTQMNTIVNLQYDYQSNYYNIHVIQKLRYVSANNQSREVISIILNSQSNDFNSVIDLHANIGQKKYDLWLPLCFIEWTNENVNLKQKEQVKCLTIRPDRQYACYESASKILPLNMKIAPRVGELHATLYGRSRFGCHQITLTWCKQQLTINCSVTLLDFLAFVMHHFI